MRLDRHEQIIRERFLRAFYRAYEGKEDAQPSVNHHASFFPTQDVFKLGALKTLAEGLPRRAEGLTLRQRIALSEMLRSAADIIEAE